MKKFTSIEQFRNVVKYINKTHSDKIIPTLEFIGTVKLHGSNVSIRRLDNTFSFHSRNNTISPEQDNYGFAAYMYKLLLEDNKINYLFDEMSGSNDVTLFGEWIGPGIQKNVAISELPEKQFVIFGAWDHNSESYIQNQSHWSIPECNIFNILNVPSYNISINFARPEEALDTLQQLTMEVENECPWGKKFGISGIGEGIVFTPKVEFYNSELYFKVKGDKHGNKTSKKQNKVANISPEKLATIREVIDHVLPDWRLEQGISYLNEQNLELIIKNMGEYLKWVGQDVKKEEMDTIEENGLDWKELSKFISRRAKDYYIEQIRDF